MMIDEDEDEDEYTTPRKTIRLSNLMKQDDPRTPIQNRYTSLPIEKTPIVRENSQTQTVEKILKTKACPPIVIKGTPANHKMLTDEINKYVKNGFYLKYAAKSTLLYIKDEKEFTMYKNHLIQQNEDFHTYTTYHEKTHAFVLKGLQGDIDTEEIKLELKNNKINVNNVYKMKTKFRPLYLVITNKEITLKILQNKIKYVQYTKITWERRLNERPIIQCRRCQGWGHATANCNHKPACLKCAQDHLTKDCPKPAETPPKCVNCQQNHTASNTECPVYVRRLEELLKRKHPEAEERQPRYQPAPPPVRNAWHERQQTRQENPPLPPQSPPQRPRQSQQQSASQLPTAGDFSELIKETNKLNSFIDLSETIKAIQALNNLIENIKDPLEIINKVQYFATNILPNFQILPPSRP